MDGRTYRSVAAMIANPSAICDSQPWARFVYDAHAEARRLETSFNSEKHNTMNLMAPRGNIITSAGDPSSVAQDLQLTIFTEVIPPHNIAAAAPKGALFISAGLRKLVKWRVLLFLLLTITIATKFKLLTRTGHGSVSILHSDIYPLAGRFQRLRLEKQAK
jgi:hypothetical protein